MKLNIIDYDNWDRREIFERFCPCSYSITAEVDITRLIATIKAAGYKFYPTICYIISQVVNSRVDYRYAYIDGNVGYYDRVDPLYTLMRKNSTLFTHTVTEYVEDFHSFYKAFESDRTAAENGNTLYYGGREPDNVLCISITPTLSFKQLSFCYNMTREGSLVPFVTIGKYYEQNGKIMLPLATEFRHEVNDGYHSSLFYELIQLAIDRFQ